MPTSDPAYPIVSTILDIVPASRWTFARISPNGDDLLLILASDGNDDALADLTDEFKRQRQKAATGPRIAATLGSLGDFASGITPCSRTRGRILVFLRSCARPNWADLLRAKSAY
jgi:hypothetical protein